LKNKEEDKQQKAAYPHFLAKRKMEEKDALSRGKCGANPQRG